MKNGDPKEVKEMRDSLDAFARTARRATRGAKESQRNLRISLAPKSGYDALTDAEIAEARARVSREG